MDSFLPDGFQAKSAHFWDASAIIREKGDAREDQDIGSHQARRHHRVLRRNCFGCSEGD